MHYLVLVDKTPLYKVMNPSLYITNTVLPDILSRSIKKHFQDNDGNKISYSLQSLVELDKIDEETFNESELEDISCVEYENFYIHSISFIPTPPLKEIINSEHFEDEFKKSLVKALVNLQIIEAGITTDKIVDLTIALSKKSLETLVSEYFGINGCYAQLFFDPYLFCRIDQSELPDKVKPHAIIDFYREVLLKITSSVYFKNSKMQRVTICFYKEKPTV